jgi:hypothetical protein
MPILITCDCGTKLRARDEQSGKRIRCPSCKEILEVPEAGAAPTTPVPRKDSVSPSAISEKGQPKRRSSAPEDDERPTSRKSRSGIKKELPEELPEIEDEEEERPRKKSRLKKNVAGTGTKNVSGSTWGLEGAGFRRGVLGGIAMMVIACVWFVGGLFAGYIFFYPPILFIIGLVALIKGIIDGNVAGKG